MTNCKIYNIDNEKDLEKLKSKYPEDLVKKRLAQLKQLAQKKEHEFKNGDCCPMCGSIEYYNSGTCKTCRTCGHAGGCG